MNIELKILDDRLREAMPAYATPGSSRAGLARLPGLSR
jgi:hypothetical protein